MLYTLVAFKDGFVSWSYLDFVCVCGGESFDWNLHLGHVCFFPPPNKGEKGKKANFSFIAYLL